MYVDPNGSNFATKLLAYLQEADYRVASSRVDREEIYRLRYESYLNEGAIGENPSRMFNDDYDDFDNCWIFGIHLDEKLVGSIRFHVITPEDRKGPAYDVFPDLVGPMLDDGLSLIDPTRFAADIEATKNYPEMPFLTLRVACMAYEYFGADYVLATVRKEHAAFYRRVFNAEFMCEPRPYPLLNSSICLLRANVRGVREKLARRYPIFESSLTERRMIFDQPVNVQQVEENRPFIPVIASNA